MGSDTVVGFASAPLEIIDGDRGTNYPKQSDFSLSGDCLFLNTGNVTSNGFDFTQLNFISREKDQQLRKGKAKRYDVILTTRGTVGNVSYYDQSVPFEDIRINSGMVLLRADRRKLWPQYLYYFVRSSLFGTQVASLSTGSAQPQLPIRDINRVKIRIPSLDEQRAIAAVLGALDDKIELNRRMNGTLEAMARALFKSWFVDFDPVRAKMEGRPTGLPGEIEALFVGEMEAGRPLGWGVGSVDDEFDLTMGQSPPGNTYNEVGDGLPFYQGKTDFGFRFPTRRIYCSAPTRFAEAGDTLVSVRAPVGTVNMANERCCVGRGVAAIRHKLGSRSYTYYMMESLKGVFDRFEAEGTVFGSINKKDFHAISIVNAPQSVIHAFEELVFPLDQVIENNERQSATLAALRDALLPKLMSGEVRISHAENLFEVI